MGPDHAICILPNAVQRIVMPIASMTEPAVMAGALAARVRENVEVALSAIGVDAVGNAMRAICYARLYLEVIPIHAR